MTDPTAPAWLEAWLGPAAETTTEEQRDELLRLNEQIDELADEDDDTTEVLAGAAMLVLGDANLEALAAQWKTAKARERAAMDRLRGAIIASVGRGVSQRQVAARAGLNLDTVRRAIGRA